MKTESGNRIDHLVYTVLDLDKAIVEFEAKLGIRPTFGGYHQTFGTKNALIKLGTTTYLELLAADANNNHVKRPRWMGVDVLKKPQVTRWAIRSTTLAADSLVLKKHHTKMGTISAGSRQTDKGAILNWTLTMPLPLPEVELVPFALDWSASEAHPTDALPDSGCELVEFYGTHPNPDLFTPVFENLKLDFQIKKSSEIQLKLLVKTSNGTVTL